VLPLAFAAPAISGVRLLGRNPPTWLLAHVQDSIYSGSLPTLAIYSPNKETLMVDASVQSRTKKQLARLSLSDPLVRNAEPLKSKYQAA
jgi:hypothetical protein